MVIIGAIATTFAQLCALTTASVDAFGYNRRPLSHPDQGCGQPVKMPSAQEKRYGSDGPVMTIDGPSGAGKGTLCQLLAEKLGWHLLDSGAIYRVLSLAALHHDVELDSEAALVPLAANLDVQFQVEGELVKVILEGEDVSRTIRTEEVGNAASKKSRRFPGYVKPCCAVSVHSAKPRSHRRRSRHGYSGFPRGGCEDFPRRQRRGAGPAPL